MEQKINLIIDTVYCSEHLNDSVKVKIADFFEKDMMLLGNKPFEKSNREHVIEIDNSGFEKGLINNIKLLSKKAKTNGFYYCMMVIILNYCNKVSKDTEKSKNLSLLISKTLRSESKNDLDKRVLLDLLAGIYSSDETQKNILFEFINKKGGVYDEVSSLVDFLEN